MKDHDTNVRTDIAKLETESPADLGSVDFDAATVFADPVTYLAGFGIRSELAEIHRKRLPAAA